MEIMEIMQNTWQTLTIDPIMIVDVVAQHHRSPTEFPGTYSEGYAPTPLRPVAVPLPLAASCRAVRAL